MRESVLLALIHIFAIVSTVSPFGISSRGRRILREYLRRYLNRELEEEYYTIFENNLEFYSGELKRVDSSELSDEDSLISFQITNICRQIRKGLFMEERMIVFLQLIEFAIEDGMISAQEKNIIDIVAKTFSISGKEHANAAAFIISRSYDDVSPDCMLVIESDSPDAPAAGNYENYDRWKHIKLPGFRGRLFVMHIESAGALLVTYEGPLALNQKGRDIKEGRPYLLERGVNIKGREIEPIYYSQVYKQFVLRAFPDRVVFEGSGIEYRFRNSDNGVQNMSFKIESGNMVGIMGGSGVGKSTLFSLLNGKIKPTSGSICINGYDISSGTDELNGIIGFVPQDDMLIEELTVYQNLYYNARLCFGDFTEDQINGVIEKVLSDLDLGEIKDLQVGDALNKKVSGGQRKRLNIGLELMREPMILFVDEPTSGLSSFDSVKVVTLLHNQALQGKLVFVIIHQPSSDIIKMFDRLWILDKGGYMVYDGNPVEALVYFKTETSQANAAESECPYCGNVETDSILDIIEVKTVDADGMPGPMRQVSPQQWHSRYRKKMMPQPTGLTHEKQPLPPNNFRVPGRLKQIKTFISRNTTRKLADSQYMLINILEAPLLAIILGYISKYSADGSTYTFAGNKNYPVFIFMGIVVALFMGLTVSAEEIFRDRKILEREKFLNLSRLSYLLSKTSLLFLMSAIQTLSFLAVASAILEIRGLMLQQWLVLFSTACFGNILGLNISAGMRSAISIYILIPLILVPQLLLGGVMIKFDDLHWSLSRRKYVPVIGDIMVTRWAYEAQSVEQFRSNCFQKPFYGYDMEISQHDWNASFLIPVLKSTVDNCILAQNDPEKEDFLEQSFKKLDYHINDLAAKYSISGIPEIAFSTENFNKCEASAAKAFLDSLSRQLRMRIKTLSDERNTLYRQIEAETSPAEFIKLQQWYRNEALADLTLNRISTGKIYDAGDRFVQKADPVYMPPDSRWGRAHFFAPCKQLGNLKINTLIFNLLVIWSMNLMLFATLYFNLLKRLITLLESLRLPVLRKFGREILQN
ncbi:MAG: ATP-binding cassette domain-containing protein [Bacteroidales bacterium]|jgi:ABC-type multidrug transport system ATPase subunit|nr:ATP-binding cassette domain-containing protein [Bacteroidales bacterium]